MNLRSGLREILQYPSALAGVIIILLLFVVSLYAVISIPYSRAVDLWRGMEQDWYQNPKLAEPLWTNWFRKDKLPETIDLKSTSDNVSKTISATGDSSTIEYTFDIPFNYNTYSNDFAIFFTSDFISTAPFVSLTWITPDGREINLGNFALKDKMTYRVSQDTKLTARLGGAYAHVGLFAGPDYKSSTPLQGTYQLRITGTTFEPNSDFSAEVILYGEVAGWAGTDNLRRDIGIALLWGTPVALLFGLLAAVGTSLSQLIIAGISTWFGGWVDTIIQRVTEINLVLPFLPILIMVGTFYSRSLFLMLSVVILLSIFGSGIKTFRAVFMQVKESPYIEAARSYGASNTRIIFQYMIPRLIPMLIPQFITLVPSYVFLEASLAVLGLGDPTLPTWGKLIDDSYNHGALFQGWYYWVLEPSVLLMITGLAFSSVGYAMDRIFNPRLRGQ
jgi:peptide/nickel transport system permease protein